MVQLAVLLIVVALAGAAAVVLARRRRSLDTQAVAKALAAAAERLAAGKAPQARRRYARLAQRLAAGPEELRPQRGLALLGQAEATVPTGDQQATLALHREAFPLLADPARQLPRWSLHRLAEERISAPEGDLGPLLAFLQATADGAEPGEEAAAAARATDWLQRLCHEGSPEQRESATTRSLAALPGRDWPVLARAALLRGTDRAAEAETLLAAAAPAAAANSGSAGAPSCSPCTGTNPPSPPSTRRCAGAPASPPRGGAARRCAPRACSSGAWPGSDSAPPTQPGPTSRPPPPRPPATPAPATPSAGSPCCSAPTIRPGTSSPPP